MGFHRLTHSFTAGELSPLMSDRVDFERYKNGCRKLYNATCATQGPAIRRPGTKFIYNLNSLGLDTTDPQLRMIPFIFNEDQAYVMIFFMHTDGDARMVLGTDSGLVVFDSPPITECPPGTPVTVSAGSVVMLTLPSGWDNATFDWAQSADEMYIAQSGLQPHIIKRHSHTCWELASVTFTDQPSDWDATKGWPEKVTFHQQRIAFAANLLRRQTVWMSKAGDFSDFGVSSPLVDSDAVTFTLDSGTQNRIQWITSGKSLHVGTLGNEWTVVGGTQTALTPTNILAQRQTNNGSEANKPLLVGLTTLFVERHGRIINEFVYDYTFDSYKTSDMAILSPHITEEYSVIDWTYQQTPDSIIWCVREDGELLGITYQRQHKVVGWHTHHTEGEFKAISSIPGDTREDDVWFVVKRTIEGQSRYYVEKLEDWFKDTSAEYGRFLDSHVVYQGAPASSLAGATHLIGEEVHILADGTVHPPVTVGGTGIIQLNNSYSHVVVGLPYTTEIRPHLVDVPSQGGSSLGQSQRITSVAIDFYRSLGAYIGVDNREDGELEEELPFRVPGDLTGQQVPLYTGWYVYDFPEGFDEKSEYFLRQKQPLPLTVRAVVDTVEVFD